MRPQPREGSKQHATQTRKTIIAGIVWRHAVYLRAVASKPGPRVRDFADCLGALSITLQGVQPTIKCSGLRGSERLKALVLGAWLGQNWIFGAKVRILMLNACAKRRGHTTVCGNAVCTRDLAVQMFASLDPNWRYSIAEKTCA